MKAITCITALENGLKIANRVPELKKQVIPVVMIGDMAHTKYHYSQFQNPNGPQQVVEQSRRLGAIPIQITPDTLRKRLNQTIQQILKGEMPT